eukprot:2700781-Lingulodinium_polyedra.AAC.1
MVALFKGPQFSQLIGGRAPAEVALCAPAVFPRANALPWGASSPRLYRRAVASIVVRPPRLLGRCLNCSGPADLSRESGRQR